MRLVFAALLFWSTSAFASTDVFHGTRFSSVVEIEEVTVILNASIAVCQMERDFKCVEDLLSHYVARQNNRRKCEVSQEPYRGMCFKALKGRDDRFLKQLFGEK